MSLLGLLLLLLLLGLIIYEISRRRRHRKGPGNRPSLKVVTLGQPNVGKTVFLGSMYHDLSIADASGVYLSTDDNHRRPLLELYDQVRDPDQDFPPPTMLSEFREWPFETKVKSRHGTFRAFDFTYVDYAGEHARALIHSEQMDSVVLRQAIQEADVLMVMLDGVLVRDVLDVLRQGVSANATVNKFYKDLRGAARILVRLRQADTLRTY